MRNGYIKTKYFLSIFLIHSNSICVAWLFRPGFNSSDLRLLTDATTKASSVVNGVKVFFQDNAHPKWAESPLEMLVSLL